MSAPFEIDYIVLCDYSSFTTQNKVINAGIYSSELHFATLPSVWVPLSIVTSLIPKQDKFDFSIKFVRPDGKALIEASGTFEAQSPLVGTERAVLNLQLPPVKFTGVGTYRIEVQSGGTTIFSRAVHVGIGAPPPKIPPKVTFNINVDVS
jgi:hypothetical protein